MSTSELLLRIAVSILGAGALVGFSMWRKTAKVWAFIALLVGVAAIWVSGQSVLTSGAATFSALAFLASQWVPRWREMLYRSFFVVFKIIWLGIGINAVYNVGAVFAGWGGLEIASPTWFFAEAMFAVLILNGVYIGKVLGPGIAAVLKSGVPPDQALVAKIAASGSVSFVSWYSWLLARKGLLEAWSMADLFAMWIGMILVVFGLTILSETLRRTIHARPAVRT